VAERARPMPLQIAERVVELLGEIGKDETSWWTKPMNVALFTAPSDVEMAKPLILVNLVRVGTTAEPITELTMHGDFVELNIHFIADAGADPHGVLHEGAADIRRCIRQNHTVGDLAITLWDSGYDPGIESKLGGAGMVEAVVHTRALYSTDEENP